MQEPEDIYYNEDEYENSITGGLNGVELIEEDDLSDSDDSSFLDDICFFCFS